jgi:hypothetical protein
VARTAAGSAGISGTEGTAPAAHRQRTGSAGISGTEGTAPAAHRQRRQRAQRAQRGHRRPWRLADPGASQTLAHRGSTGSIRKAKENVKEMKL